MFDLPRGRSIIARWAGCAAASVLLDVMVCIFVAIFAVRLNAHSQAGKVVGGVRPLDEETYEEAIECGKSGADCAVTPYLLCPSEDQRYSAWIATPYSRVASSVYEAIRRHARLRPPEPGAANAWGIGVFVSPGRDPQKADSIEHVFLRRGNEIIRPTTATLAPAVVAGSTGDRTHRSRGYFAFPMDAFSPAMGVTVVFVGPAGEVKCAIDQRKLSTLR